MSKHLQYQPSYVGTLTDPPIALDWFLKRIRPDMAVMEIGTKQWVPGVSTHHKALFPDPSQYAMVDAQEGIDVDYVVDAHYLWEVFGPQCFDAIWCSSVFEHLHSPWIVASQILKSLNPGGIFFIQTHLAFPEHGYPNDYFRFTTQGLEHLFRGASEKVSCYDFPAKLTPENTAIDWNQDAPNYLNVLIAGKK